MSTRSGIYHEANRVFQSASQPKQRFQLPDVGDVHAANFFFPRYNVCSLTAFYFAASGMPFSSVSRRMRTSCSSLNFALLHRLLCVPQLPSSRREIA